jgi:DNA-binding response OmpR family regulator
VRTDPSPSVPGSEAPPSTLRTGNLEIRPAEYQVLADGVRVGLTVREFQTFLVLAERYDRVVPRPRIYVLVWGGRMPYRDRSVDVFVRKLRRKLSQAAPAWTYIHTHFGIGYRFMPERTEAEAGSSAGAASDPDPSRSRGDGADPLARGTATPAAG